MPEDSGRLQNEGTAMPSVSVRPAKPVPEMDGGRPYGLCPVTSCIFPVSTYCWNFAAFPSLMVQT